MSIPVVPPHRALGLTDEELLAIAAKLGRAPNDLELTMFGVMWSEHCSHKSSRALLRTLPTERPGRDRGPGRERRGPADRRWAGGRPQDRVARPPLCRGAIPGRRDRGGRHPARHLRDGRPPDRHPRRAPLRRPWRRADAPPRAGRRRRHRRLRELRGRADGRRRARLRPDLRGQPAGQRDGHRARPRGPDHACDGARPGQPRRPLRLDHRPGRDRRRVGPRLGDVR